jgi:hypothetical protein
MDEKIFVIRTSIAQYTAGTAQYLEGPYRCDMPSDERTGQSSRPVALTNVLPLGDVRTEPEAHHLTC